MCHTWEKQEVHTEFYFGKPRWETEFGRSRSSFRGNFKMDFRWLYYENV